MEDQSGIPPPLLVAYKLSPADVEPGAGEFWTEFSLRAWPQVGGTMPSSPAAASINAKGAMRLMVYFSSNGRSCARLVYANRA